MIVVSGQFRFHSLGSDQKPALLFLLKWPMGYVAHCQWQGRTFFIRDNLSQQQQPRNSAALHFSLQTVFESHELVAVHQFA